MKENSIYDMTKLYEANWQLHSFIGGGNQITLRKLLTCHKLLTNLSHNVVHLALTQIRTHNVSGDKH
jgi:hypothetical protein